jgi:O-antigen/teichoic acid export membrane protein
MIFDKLTSLSPLLLARLLFQRVRSDSLVRNSIYIMASTVATAVIGYLYWAVATHIYSTASVGLASALIAIMTLTSALANLGIDSTLVQMLPHRKPGYAWSLTLNAGVTTGTLAGLLTAGIMVVVLPLFSQQFTIFHQTSYALIFVTGVPLLITATLLDQTFVAEQTADKMLARNIIFSVFKLVLMVLPVLLFQVISPNAGTLGIFSSYVLALLITLIGSWLLLIPRLKRSYCLVTRGIVGQIRTMFSSFAGHHFINIGGLAPMYLLPVFVIARLSPTENAYYYTTSMISAALFMISSAVAAALFAEGSHDRDSILRKTRFSAVAIGILLCPVVIAILLCGRYILLLFGPVYAQHGLLLLTILTIAAVPDAVTNIYVSVLRVQRRLCYAALFNLGMAMFTLTLAWVLLPVLNIAGVGWAFLIAQGTGSLVAGADMIRIHQQGRRSARAGSSDSVAGARPK